jgi:hypothetical protein
MASGGQAEKERCTSRRSALYNKEGYFETPFIPM